MRFPGFEGDWEEKKLGDLLEFKNGINASKEQYGKGVKFINVLDILNNDYITNDNIIGLVDVDNATIEKYAVKHGDILFQRSSETREEVGTANVYLDKEKNATFGGFVIRGRKIGDYDPIFFNKLLKTNAARDSITSKSGGSTRYNIGQEILTSITLHFPNLFEQEKIASFLTLIDERITTQNKIIEELKSLIKGLREKMFSQQYYFNDNNKNKFSSWKKISLSEIFIKNSAKNQNQKYSRVQSISNKYGFINQDDFFENRRVASIDTTNYYVVGKGYFAYNPSRIDVGSLAYKFDNEISVISPLYISFRAKNNFILDIFLLNWFSTNEFMWQMNSSFEGSVRNTLSYESLSKMYISLPCIEEQELIINSLSSIDKKIELEKKILEKFRLQKNYLLYNIFY